MVVLLLVLAVWVLAESKDSEADPFLPSKDSVVDPYLPSKDSVADPFLPSHPAGKSGCCTSSSKMYLVMSSISTARKQRRPEIIKYAPAGYKYK